MKTTDAGIARSLSLRWERRQLAALAQDIGEELLAFGDAPDRLSQIVDRHLQPRQPLLVRLHGARGSAAIAPILDQLHDHASGAANRDDADDHGDDFVQGIRRHIDSFTDSGARRFPAAAPPDFPARPTLWSRTAAPRRFYRFRHSGRLGRPRRARVGAPAIPAPPARPRCCACTRSISYPAP